jgi:hypothetical protein
MIGVVGPPNPPVGESGFKIDNAEGASVIPLVDGFPVNALGIP